VSNWILCQLAASLGYVLHALCSEVRVWCPVALLDDWMEGPVKKIFSYLRYRANPSFTGPGVPCGWYVERVYIISLIYILVWSILYGHLHRSLLIDQSNSFTS
jgi:hypothetical protein